MKRQRPLILWVFYFMEFWKKIEGFESYEISNYGRLRKILKFRKNRDYNAIMLKPSFDKDGYLRTVLTISKTEKYNKTIHRLVALSFIDNTENKPQINHKDGNKSNNLVENLEWCTAKENSIHAIKLGLSGQAPGEMHHMSKLKLNDVLEIRENKDNLSQRKMAVIYGISQTQISRILNNKRWY